MTDTLAATLWHAPLPDPEAPQRALMARVDGLDYAQALEALRPLVRHALPVTDALQAALDRWPWSVDLGWLTFEATGDPAPLETIVRREGRRFGTLAWALWQSGQPEAALAATEGLNPASPSHAEDARARAELRILADLPADPPLGGEGARLALLALWRTQGGAVLAQHFDASAGTLPAHPPLWVFLIDAFVTERDFGRARAALDALARHHGSDHPEVRAQQIRLALDCDDPGGARALLDALPATPPWTWGARRLAQDLRCRRAEGAEGQRDRTAAALRLFPRHGALQGLHRAAREADEDWAFLAADPAADAGWLIRLGRADLALSRQETAPAPPDEVFRRALRRAEAHLRLGQLEAARNALPPLPDARPLAADHAWWQAEIALAARDFDAAGAALAPALIHSPTRMGLLLSAARLAFFKGEDARALAHLDRFRDLRTAQLGQVPPDDLRDLIVQDAARGPDGPGDAARAFARARPAFQAADAPPIPRRIAHYWEGPLSAPVNTGLRAWGALMEQRLFDAPAARDWLARHRPELVALFDRQPLPATRADLFRVALIAQEGGLFADLDEYPRQGIDDWLTGARGVFVVEEGHGTIANNFLAALPGLPLFARLRSRIAEALGARAAPYPWWDSGPAPLTLELRRALDSAEEAPGLRLLTQPDYDARIATNLPFAHKTGPLHWR